MRSKLIILGFWVAACVCVWLITPAGGTCDSGINKNHLDTTPGAFVDGTTLEVTANGLRVKPAAVGANIAESFAMGVQTHVSTGDTVWTDLTGLSVSITPTSVNSKVRVSFTVNGDTNDGNVGIAVRILRNTGSGFSEIAAITPTSRGNRLAAQVVVGHAYGERSIGQGHFSFIDCPGVGTSVSYKLQATCINGYTWYINRDYFDSDDSNHYTVPSSIRLEEIYMP